MVSDSFEGNRRIFPKLGFPRFDLRLLTQEDALTIMLAFLSRIITWHKEVKPNIIILTATSATPYGYLIKTAWRTAFPTEEQPIFMNIDPRHLPGMGLSRLPNAKEEDALPAEKRIGKSSRILVFDEMSRDPESELGSSNLRKVTDLTEKYGRTLPAVVNYLETIGIPKENLWQDDGDTELHRIVKAGPNLNFRSPLKRDYAKKADENEYHMRLAKPTDEVHRQTAQAFIADMKSIGRIVGEKIVQQISVDKLFSKE